MSAGVNDWITNIEDGFGDVIWDVQCFGGVAPCQVRWWWGVMGFGSFPGATSLRLVARVPNKPSALLVYHGDRVACVTAAVDRGACPPSAMTYGKFADWTS